MASPREQSDRVIPTEQAIIRMCRPREHSGELRVSRYMTKSLRDRVDLHNYYTSLTFQPSPGGITLTEAEKGYNRCELLQSIRCQNRSFWEDELKYRLRQFGYLE
jgi:hypothetical protein